VKAVQFITLLCASVRFRLAAFAAFLIFRRAADRCFDATISHPLSCRLSHSRQSLLRAWSSMCQAMAGLGHINRTSASSSRSFVMFGAERHSDDVVDAAWRDSANTLDQIGHRAPGPGPGLPIPVIHPPPARI